MSSLLADVLTAQGFDVSVAADGVRAREEIDDFDPDAAILDIGLGDGPSGVDLAMVLHRQRPDIALLLLTHHADLRTAGYADQDVPPGCGFLRKDRVRDTAHLMESLESVLSDRPDRVRDDQDPAKPLAALDAKQLEVLRLMALGYTNEYIAQTTGSGLSTIERRTISIFRTLGIDTHAYLNPRVEAVRLFIAATTLPERR